MSILLVLATLTKRGQKTRLPIIDERGSPGYYIYGAQWTQWTFRVNSPDKMIKNQLMRGIRRYTAFWAKKNGVSTKDATFIIELKRVDVPTEFVPDLLAKNRQKPWESFGLGIWKNNKFNMEVNPGYDFLFLNQRK